LNVGALVAVASAAVPTWTEGNEVLLSTNLAGGVRAAQDKLEDAASVDGDVGAMVLSVRNDTLPTTPSTSATGDYQTITTDRLGRLWVASDVLATFMQDHNDLLRTLITELRIHTVFLQSGLNVQDDPSNYRNDPSFSQVN